MRGITTIIALLASLLILIFSLVLWRLMDASGRKAPKNYNILLISIDTCRADFLGAYGNRLAHTPNIDSLAKQGVLFENYYTTINVTLGSHASIFTGLYPRNHGVGRNNMRLNRKNLTMAEFLVARGYITAAFVGAFALASVFGINQGFQHYEESFYGDARQYIQDELQFKTKQNNPLEFLEKNPVLEFSRSAEEVNRAFFQWLGRRQAENFFSFVHYYDPHFPYKPPKEFYSKHLKSVPDKIPFTQDELETYRVRLEREAPRLGPFHPGDMTNPELSEGLQAMTALYLSEIEYVDNAIGEILKELERANLRSNTIVILTADHGENLIDHPEFKSFFNHGLLTHESETRIPLIISCPGFLPSGRRVQQNSSEVDLFPTLMALLGYKAPAGDGVNLQKILFNDHATLPERPIFSESTQPLLDLNRYANQLIWINDRNAAAVRLRNLEYIYIPWAPYEAIFDISTDRSEEKNLLPQIQLGHPELLSEFRRHLQVWRSKAMQNIVDKSFQLNKEDEEKLRSLGYVQ